MAPLIRDLKNFFISHILLFHCYEISNKLRFRGNKSNRQSFLTKVQTFWKNHKTLALKKVEKRCPSVEAP